MVLAAAMGGALGSALRYVVGVAVVQRAGPGFPWGTLLINLSGSFAIGIIAELTQTRAFGASVFLRVFLMVGVLGGFTTFSTFAFETTGLIREGAAPLALAYVVGSVVIGVAAAFAGMTLVRIFQH